MRPFTVKMLIQLLSYLASRPEGFVVINCDENSPLAKDAHPQFMNILWYAVREGYARPAPKDALWVQWLSLNDRGMRLPSLIPARFERELTERGECSLMITPRGELRLRQLFKEFKED